MRRVLVALAVLLALVLAACGIPTDDEPRVIADETTVPDAAGNTEPGTATATVVLVVSETNELVTRERTLEGPSDPETVLDTLLMTPSEDELADGLTTSIPPTAEALSVTADGGVWLVDMSSDWRDLAGQNALYAYAQVVLTLTRLPGVEQVRFAVDGSPVADAPTDTLGAREVLSAADYQTLDPTE